MAAEPVMTPAFAQAMAGAPAPVRVTPADAFKAAQVTVHAGTRLDMLALADELGVARATLYRWTGDRERLLADILWAEVSTFFEYVVATIPGHGSARLGEIASRFLSVLASSPLLTTFLEIEGPVGFRIITDPEGGLRPRLVRAIATAIEREVDGGRYVAPEDPELLADAIVSLGERFLYHGGHVETNPDGGAASRMIALLVRESF